MFTYNEEKDVFIHWPSSFILAGDYVRIADNDEIKNKFYAQTGKLIEDFAIEVMRIKVADR